MRGLSAVVAGLLIVAAQFGSADAAVPRKHQPVMRRPMMAMHHPIVMRSAAGTVIQPTKTIIRHADGSATVIVIPRRSYLDTGTEVSVGDRSFLDYMLPPGGDPGRPNWFYGPDVSGYGGYPLRPFDIPGFNPDTPF